MKVTSQNWRMAANNTRYAAALPDDAVEKDEEKTIDDLMGKDEDNDTFLAYLESIKSKKD